jgi:hypothetical protein
MAIEVNSIPMVKVIEVELDTGFMLYELFPEDENAKENPWSKLVFAYLSALTDGKEVTWQQMKLMGQKQIDQLTEVKADDVDPKDESVTDN